MLIKNLNEMRFDVGSMMLVDERFLIAITRLTLYTYHGIFIKNWNMFATLFSK